MPSTPAQRWLRGARLRQICWLRYPDGLGRMFQAVDYPRLTRISRPSAGGGAEAFWLVDGVPVLDLEEAIEALDVPPVLAAEELELLRQVPDEWTTPEDLRALITAGIPHADGYAKIRLLRALADKGFLEVDDARIRRGSLPAAD